MRNDLRLPARELEASAAEPAELISFRMEFAGDIPGVIERLRAVGAAFGDVIIRITVEAGT